MASKNSIEDNPDLSLSQEMYTLASEGKYLCFLLDSSHYPGHQERFFLEVTSLIGMLWNQRKNWLETSRFTVDTRLITTDSQILNPVNTDTMQRATESARINRLNLEKM